MTDKYYTPSIEDIRVGYEVESHEWCIDEIGTPERNYDRWTTKILDKSHVETILKYGIKGIRVPCLTKEQVEAEKWENIEDLDDDGAFNATKTIGGIIYKLTWTSDKAMQIWDTNFQHCVYFGSCPSINEFRFICKLLNI